MTSIVAFFIVKPQSLPNSEFIHTQPSLSPSTSSPLDVIDYETPVRDVVIKISGEDVLRNTSSIQYSVFQILVEEMPLLVEDSILHLNESNVIAQKYLLGVLGLSASRETEVPVYVRRTPRPCQVPTLVCNDEEEIIKLSIQNQWMSVRGGGFIASEIAEFKALTHLILSRNGLHSTIPTKIGKLKNLQYLDLSGNELTAVFQQK